MPIQKYPAANNVIEWDQFSRKCGQNKIGKIFFIYLT